MILYGNCKVIFLIMIVRICAYTHDQLIKTIDNIIIIFEKYFKFIVINFVICKQHNKCVWVMTKTFNKFYFRNDI